MDHYGVTSFIRWLRIDPVHYYSLLYFFRSSSWDLGNLMRCWMNWVYSSFPVVKLGNRVLTAGDGIKIPKEATRQPGVKTMYKSSSNSSTPAYFQGHHIGFISFIVGVGTKVFSVLIAGQIHEGVEELRERTGDNDRNRTVVTRMVNLIIMAAKLCDKPLYSVLDGLFSTGTAFRLASSYLMGDGNPWVHIITKAKTSYVAYINDELEGRLKLWSVFSSTKAFMKDMHPTKLKNQILYLCKDLYWPPANAFIRFVWVIDEGKYFLLMCSDTNLKPLDIIKGYCLRSSIELSFKNLKHVIGGFGYRFWSKFWPSSLLKVKTKQLISPKALDKGVEVLAAIERFVNLSAIALGILQYLSISLTDKIWKIHKGTSWLRTYSSEIPSEEVVQRVLQITFLSNNILNWLKINFRKSDIPKLENSKKVRLDSTLGRFMLS